MSRAIQEKIIIILILSIALFSCKYEKIVPLKKLPENVSFQNDLIPFFNKSCNSLGCHSEGAIPPDLSPKNAYASITTKAKMIDLKYPKKSVMYTRMIDTRSPMPPQGVMQYESLQVLSWITDGAKNN